jgi:hypothetical protein
MVAFVPVGTGVMNTAAAEFKRRTARQALGLVVLMVAAQVATAAHFLLVRHTVCPIDGALVDLPRHYVRSPTRPVGTQPQLARPDPTTPEASERLVEAPPPLDVQPTVALVPEQATGVADPRAPQIDVYRTSPKQSPPV